MLLFSYNEVMGIKVKTALVVIIVIMGILKIVGCANMGQRIDPQSRSWFEEHRWSYRVLILTGDNEIVNAQLELFSTLDAELANRNLLIINSNDSTIFFGNNIVGVPNTRGTMKRFGLDENQYEMVLIGKDGGVKRRYSNIVDPQVIFDIIDAMPMRMREMQSNDSASDTVSDLPKENDSRVMFDFSDLNYSSSWFLLLDGVMGGKSTGNLENNEHTITFTGEVSLKNNGGFSSIQSSIHPTVMDGMNAIKIKIKGDGREWILAGRKFMTPTADDYWFKFNTTGDWQEVVVPISKMKRRVYGFPMIGRITPDQIKGLSFYIYDKKSGPYSLEIESVDAISQ
ncbi:MAG: hypothetical protein CMJ26_04140 [Phycisphaerae bacterium]|nr:hypothetical protein [Phycisphaerae bacterium]